MPLGTSEAIEIEGRHCKLSVENEGLLVQMHGFPDAEAVRVAFKALRHALACVSVDRRVAILIPVDVHEAQATDIRFMNDDIRCVAHGWPEGARGPVRMIGSDGAWVYPEHEYVAIDGVIRLNMPTLSCDLVDVAEGVRDALKGGQVSPDSDDMIFSAVAAYAHAGRSTQHVWRFLLLVMSLESLASPVAASEKVRLAALQLIETVRAEPNFINDTELQDALCSALRMAGKESITAAVQRLIREHCAPGVAAHPHPSLFTDASDCDAKVKAMYALRSQYTHTGRVPSPKKLKGYDFSTLAHVASASVEHILRVRLGMLAT